MSWPGKIIGLPLDAGDETLYNAKRVESHRRSVVGPGTWEGLRSMELRDAMTQVSEICLQLARTEAFRGYRAMPVAFSGVLALVAAGCQAVWVRDPSQDVTGYLTLWIGTAVLGAFVPGIEMVMRARNKSSWI